MAMELAKAHAAGADALSSSDVIYPAIFQNGLLSNGTLLADLARPQLAQEVNMQ
jgi:hypothetical protein